MSLTKSNSLSQLLKTADDSKLTVYISSLSPDKIQAQRKALSRLQEDLAELRNSYKTMTEIERETQKDLSCIKKQIEKKGNHIKDLIEKMDNVCNIGELCKVDPDALRADLTRLLLWLDDGFNVGNKLTVEQIERLSLTIAQQFRSLTLEDVSVCFNKAQGGQYGEVYRLDAQVVNAWLVRYETELRDMAMEEDARLHASRRGSVHDERVSVEDVQRFNAVKIDWLKGKNNEKNGN